MALPGKLLQSLDCLTLAESARQISLAYGVDVNEADVLRLALEGRLKLSIRFLNPVEARLVACVPMEKSMYEEFPLVAAYQSEDFTSPSGANRLMFGLNADYGIYYRSDITETIKGVWDLSMLGNEKSRVEDEYQQLTTKHDVWLDCNAAAGCVLVENPKGQMYVLQYLIGPTPYETPQGKGMTEEAYYTAQCLPDDSTLVVRQSVLTALLEAFGEEHDRVVSDVLGEQTTTIPSPSVEKYPGAPGEWPVDGYIGIGSFFKRSSDHIRKYWSKEKDFPLNESGGRLYAYPTRLIAWRANREKKPRKTAPPPR